MSPVVIFGRPRRSARILPWVPFPEPGAPRMRMNTRRALAPEPHPRGTAARPAALHEAVVVAEQEVLLHLLHRVERDAHDDEQRRAAETERHGQPVRHHGPE